MDLINIDVIHLGTTERVLARFDDVLAAEIPPVRAGAHDSLNFGGDNYVVATVYLLEVKIP